MSMTDPIADLLTRIRNAIQAHHRSLDVPASKMKAAIVRILKDEGYIQDFEVIERHPQGVIRILLKYDPSGESAISGLEKVSRPGRRIYRAKDEIPSVLGGLGVTILSTSQGVLSGVEARRRGVGGEVLCSVW